MLCLVITVVGVVALARMPVDMFPAMNIPVVVVATFYSGMPPEQIETDITSRFERFFTLGSGIEHIESRSLDGRQHHQGLFSAGHESRFGRDHHLEPGDGAVAAASARDAAAGGSEAGRIQPAGMPGHGKRRGIERNPAPRPGAVHGADPDRWRARSLGTAAVRRDVPADHGVRRSLQTGSASAEPDGRGARP